MADGWAIEVTTQVMGGGESKEIYYAHMPERSAAEEAVKRHISATPDVKVEAKALVPHKTLVGVNLPEGEVGQW